MLSDFDILGLPSTDDPDLVKAAFRKRVKEVHPDHCPEDQALRNHLLFIQINQAYRRILSGLKDKPPGPKSPARAVPPRKDPLRRNPAPSAPAATASAAGQGAAAGGLIPHKDPAYVLYKTAITYFERIHPRSWNPDNERQVKIPIPGDNTREQEQLRDIVKHLTKLFPKAYYYFSLVAHEYPESIWNADARDKMRLIEERTGLYRKILESFGVWDRSGPYRVFKPLSGG